MTKMRSAGSVLTWSAVISVLVMVASVAGLVDARPYAKETENWATQARGQDVGNLLAVVALTASASRRRRGSARAGFVWLGTLLYLIYAYLVYAMALHLNALFLVYVAILGLSAYAVLFHAPVLAAGDVEFPDGAPRRAAGLTLIATGVLFGVLWLSELVPALFTGEVPPSIREAGLVVNPIHAIDLSVVLPGFVLAGYGALKGNARGLFWTAPWLAFSVLMGTSIVAAMVLMGPAGLPGTVPPAVMVSIVVAASGLALWRYRSNVREPGRPAARA